MGRGTFSLVGPGSNEGRVGAKVVWSDKGNGSFFFKLKVGKEEDDMDGWLDSWGAFSPLHSYFQCSCKLYTAHFICIVSQDSAPENATFVDFVVLGGPFLIFEQVGSGSRFGGFWHWGPFKVRGQYL